MNRDAVLSQFREGVKAGTINIDACNFDARRIAICCQAFANERALHVSGRGWRGAHERLAWQWLAAVHESTLVNMFVWTFDSDREATLFCKHVTSKLPLEAIQPEGTIVNLHLRQPPEPVKEIEPIQETAPSLPPRPDVELVFQPQTEEITTEPMQPLVPTEDQPYEVPEERYATDRVFTLPRPPTVTGRKGAAKKNAPEEEETAPESGLAKNLEYVYARHAASADRSSIKYWALAPVDEWTDKIGEQLDIKFGGDQGYPFIKNCISQALGLQIADNDFDFDYALGVLCERLFRAILHDDQRFNTQFFTSWVHVGLFGRAAPPPTWATRAHARVVATITKRGAIPPDMSSAEVYNLYNAARLNAAHAIVDEIHADARAAILVAVRGSALAWSAELKSRRPAALLGVLADENHAQQFDALYSHLHNYYHEKIEAVIARTLLELGVSGDMYVRLDVDIYSELTGQAARESDHEYMAAALRPLEFTWGNGPGAIRRAHNAPEDEPDQADALLAAILTNARSFWSGELEEAEAPASMYVKESETGAYDLLLYRSLRVGAAEYNPRAFDGVRVEHTLRIPFVLNTVSQFLANPSAYAGQFLANIREQLHNRLLPLIAKRGEFARMMLGPVGILRGAIGMPQRKLVTMLKRAQPKCVATTGVLLNMSGPGVNINLWSTDKQVSIAPWKFYVYTPDDNPIVHLQNPGDAPIAFMHLAFDTARAIVGDDDPETDMLTAAPRFTAAKDRLLSLYTTPMRAGTFAMWMFALSIAPAYLREHNIPAIVHFPRGAVDDDDDDDDDNTSTEGGAHTTVQEYDLLGTLITRKMDNRMRHYVDPRVTPQQAGERLARERKDLTTLLYYVGGMGMHSDNTRLEDNAYPLTGEELARLTQLMDDRIVLRAAQARFVYPVGGRFRAMGEDMKQKFHWHEVLVGKTTE